MSISCKYCGATAGKGYELGHRQDCISLKNTKQIQDRIEQLLGLPKMDEFQRKEYFVLLDELRARKTKNLKEFYE